MIANKIIANTSIGTCLFLCSQLDTGRLLSTVNKSRTSKELNGINCASINVNRLYVSTLLRLSFVLTYHVHVLLTIGQQDLLPVR